MFAQFVRCGADQVPHVLDKQKIERWLTQLAKRAFDVICSALVLTLGLPIFAVVALCIMIEDGRPVFYAQVRQTRGGRARSSLCWMLSAMGFSLCLVARHWIQAPVAVLGVPAA